MLCRVILSSLLRVSEGSGRNRPEGLAVLLPHADDKLLMHTVKAPVQVTTVYICIIAEVVEYLAGTHLTAYLVQKLKDGHLEI